LSSSVIVPLAGGVRPLMPSGRVMEPTLGPSPPKPSLSVTGMVTGVSTLVVAASSTASGRSLTVNDLVAVQPVLVSVKVKVTVPALTPVTTPALVTVATAVLLLVQVPPVLGVTLAVLPTFTAVAPPSVGRALTVKDTVAVQPVLVWVKVKVIVPALTPVTTPALVTVATALLLLAQVPPVLGVTFAVLPTHTAVAPPKAGTSLTVKDLVAAQPVLVSVNVKVTVPALTPVTTPALVTVATALLLLAQVPPVFGVTLAVLPTQTSVAPPVTGAPGTVVITTFVLEGEVQLFEFVTVNVYVAPAGRPVTVKLVPVPV